MARDDDLDDDALEREAQNLFAAGGPKHAPKLGTESRSISLRDVREEYQLPSELRREQAQQRAAEAEEPEPPPAPRARQQLPPIPQRTNVRPLAGRLGLQRTDGPGPFRAPAPPADDSRGWDEAYDAALPLVVGLADTFEQAAELAAQFADLKLEQRRRRFG